MDQFVPSLDTVERVGTNGIPRSGAHRRNGNFSPPVGLAYRLKPNTVFRAAFGMFYSAPDIAITYGLAENPPEAVASAFTNNEFDFLGAYPASAGFSRPAVGLPGSALNAVDPNMKTSTTYQWNAAVEQQLPASFMLTVAYTGTEDSRCPWFWV
jgi:outer membrane receptor protein involved in Fe transport